METIKVSGVRDEVVSFLDRKAEELSKKSGRKISRNQYINMVLEKELRNNLSINDDRMEHLAEGIYELSNDIKRYIDSSNYLISLIVEGE